MATVKELEKQVKALKAESAEKDIIIADMQQEVEEAQAAAPEQVVITIGKKKHTVNPSGCYLPGQGKVTAEEIAESEELQEAVLKIEGQGIIKPLENA